MYYRYKKPLGNTNYPRNNNYTTRNHFLGHTNGKPFFFLFFFFDKASLKKRTRLSNISNKANNIKPNIINLSIYKLNTNQIDLLKLGLKFCPTPNSKMG